MTSFGRIVAGGSVFIFLLCITDLFSPSFLPYFLTNYMPFSIFIIIWVMFVLGSIPSRGSRVELASGILWSVSSSFGLVYLVSLFFGFDLGLFPNNYLYMLVVLVPFTTYSLTKLRIKQKVLGYLSISPFFVLGIGQAAVFILCFLEPFVGFNDALVILSIIFVAILFPCLWFRKSRGTASVLWFLSSLGIMEIARATATISYDLSFFVFPLTGLAFLLLANEWQRIIKLRGYSLLILLPFSIAGFFYISSGMVLPKQIGLFAMLFLVLTLLFYIGIYFSVFLALALATGLGIIGYHLFILYVSYYLPWWLAYSLSLPFFAFLVYKCLFESTTHPVLTKPTISVSAMPMVSPVPTARRTPKIPSITKPSLRGHIPWPAIQDYVQAFQNLHIHMLDSELKGGIVEINRSGLPTAISGNFACVFKIRKGNNVYAVRCFYNSKIADLQERYKLISRHLNCANLRFFVDFTYVQDGILVEGKEYPILRMKWAEGDILNKFISKNLGNKNLLIRVAREFIECVIKMQKNEIAHGDLQHGNIKVMVDRRSGSVKLYFVDYDGLYVPDLRAYPAPELGHYNYQHPRRNEKHYNEKLDNFSSLVIYLSLLAIAEDSSLWKRYHDDNRIIFANRDFEKPQQSSLIPELLKNPSERVRKLTELLMKALNNDPLSDKIRSDCLVAI